MGCFISCNRSLIKSATALVVMSSGELSDCFTLDVVEAAMTTSVDAIMIVLMCSKHLSLYVVALAHVNGRPDHKNPA